MPATRPDQEIDEQPAERPAPPAPWPPGAEGPDDAEKPHKTCSDGTTAQQRGVESEVE